MKVKKVKQLNDYYCGPASLESLLDYFGVKRDQSGLAELCHTSPEEGTDNEGMVSCLKELGFEVEEHSPGTWDEMRRYIEETGKPIIVGWFSDREEPGDEHYSVAYDLSEDEITMMDPEFGDELTLSKDRFLEAWRHTEPINWYLTVEK